MIYSPSFFDLIITPAAEFTRPNDTTAYTIGDVVGPVTTPAVQTLAGVAREPGLRGTIVYTKLTMNSAVLTNASFIIYFYNTAPTPISDNSPWTVLYANRAKMIGSTTISMQTAGAGSDASFGTTTAQHFYKCADGSKDIYAVITAGAAYTPVANETFSLTIGVRRD